jgi:hypothetical protein
VWIIKWEEWDPSPFKKVNEVPQKFNSRLTTWEGYWFSAHEQWKVMEMPYYDVDLVK